MATRTKDLYEILGVPERRDPGRDQEGVPQARRQYHPDRNPGDKDAEAKLQGDLDRLRGALRPGEASSTTSSARGSSPGEGEAETTSGPGNIGDLGDLGDLSDLFGGIFGGTSFGGCWHGFGARRPPRRARARRRGGGEPLVRGLAERSHYEDPRRARDDLLHVQGERRRAGHDADHLPRVPRARRRLRRPGLLRTFTTLSALPRKRHGDREALPHVEGDGGERLDSSATRSRSRPASRTARRSVSRARARPGSPAVQPATSSSRRA